MMELAATLISNISLGNFHCFLYRVCSPKNSRSQSKTTTISYRKISRIATL